MWVIIGIVAALSVSLLCLIPVVAIFAFAILNYGDAVNSQQETVQQLRQAETRETAPKPYRRSVTPKLPPAHETLQEEIARSRRTKREQEEAARQRVQKMLSERPPKN
jgi:flagellar biosynthesis/type III secretory pathway M-ring protein FliF/YscJ